MSFRGLRRGEEICADPTSPDVADALKAGFVVEVDGDCQPVAGADYAASTSSEGETMSETEQPEGIVEDARDLPTPDRDDGSAAAAPPVDEPEDE